MHECTDIHNGEVNSAVEVHGDRTDCTNETDVHNGEDNSGEFNGEVCGDGIEGMNATNINVQDDNGEVYYREASGDKFGDTNSQYAHNREVGDDEFEDFGSRKEMAYVVKEKTGGNDTYQRSKRNKCGGLGP